MTTFKERQQARFRDAILRAKPPATQAILPPRKRVRNSLAQIPSDKALLEKQLPSALWKQWDSEGFPEFLRTDSCCIS